MNARQIKYRDVDNDTILYGIQLPDGHIVCGCCGCLIERVRIYDGSIEIIETYDEDDWQDIQESIRR